MHRAQGDGRGGSAWPDSRFRLRIEELRAARVVKTRGRILAIDVAPPRRVRARRTVRRPPLPGLLRRVMRSLGGGALVVLLAATAAQAQSGAVDGAAAVAPAPNPWFVRSSLTPARVLTSSQFETGGDGARATDAGRGAADGRLARLAPRLQPPVVRHRVFRYLVRSRPERGHRQAAVDLPDVRTLVRHQEHEPLVRAARTRRGVSWPASTHPPTLRSLPGNRGRVDRRL
jgi:hypothetical protein